MTHVPPVSPSLAASQHPDAEQATQPHPRLTSAYGHGYRFEHLGLSLVMADMRFQAGDPSPGTPVPPFALPTLDGGTFTSADLAARGPVLMIFGSATCPMTDSAAPGLVELHRRFGQRVRFVMVNVREAHPGHQLPQPADFTTKVAHARTLQTLHGLPFEVAIDDLEGTVHRAFGPKPNSAYLLGRDGTIHFRAHWANDLPALEEAVASAATGRAPQRQLAGGVVAATRRMLPFLATVLDRAGRGAWRDMWRIAPPLAGMAALTKALRRLRRHHASEPDASARR